MTDYTDFIDFKDLKAFIWVARLRSFSGAAEKMKLSQPAVSTRITKIERFLGKDARLLERDPVVLTPMGQRFLDYAQRLIHLGEDMIDAVGDRSSVRGMVRLGVSESIVHTWLSTLMKRVKESYPNLEPEIEVDVSPTLLDRLVARDLDLAFLLGPIGHPDVRSQALCSFPLAFVACDSISIPQGPLTLEGIVKHPIITFARNTQPYAALRKMLTDNKLQGTIHASASLEAVVRMAFDGVGIAVIPPAVLVKRTEAREKLRILETVGIELPDLNYLVSLPVTPDNLAAQKVAEIALQVAGTTK